jgi:hypothetical protein
MTRALKGLVGIALLAIVASHVKAQCIVQEILPPPGGPVPNNFASVASAGDVLVVGDFPGLVLPGVPGRAYVYRRIDGLWQYETTLHDPDDRQWTIFYRPATNGEVILVAAPMAEGASEFSGAVHVWRHNGVDWQYETRLFPRGDAAFNFGFSLAIEDDVAVIGARDDSFDGLNQAGSAFVFRYDRASAIWREEQKLYAFTPASDELFGASVDIHGDLIIIGANGVAQAQGAAYVFRFDGKQWIGEVELTAFDGHSGDQLGWQGSVHVRDNFAAVGAFSAPTQYGPDGGAVYTFVHRDGRWVLETKLIQVNPSKQSIDFGAPIKTTSDGNVLLIGCFGDSFGAPYAGAAYFFQRDEGRWVSTGKIGDPTPNSSGGFSSGMDINGGQAIISAINGGPEGGVVFAFDGIHQRDCDDDGVVDACEDTRGPEWPVTPMSCDVLADLDSDGSVGSSDVALLLTSWGLCPSGCAADLNADGTIDGYDLAYLLGFWGRVTD